MPGIALVLGLHRSFGLEMPDVVRLALAPRIEAAALAAVESARAALKRGEIVPATAFSGPEMSLA